jgi:Ca2+-binding RTX toxin-like protein
LLLGGAGNDTPNGEDGNDVSRGGGGVDFIIDSAGNDRMSGGDRDDTFWASSVGKDFFRGGAGFDLVDRSRIESPANVNLMTSTLVSDGFVDLLSGIEGFVGGPAGDTLTGDEGPNLFRADGGDDQIAGMGGDDRIRAGPGTDNVDGGDGTDLCVSAETAVNCEL